MAHTPSQTSNPSRQTETKGSNIFVMSMFMKESEDGSICDLKTRVISSPADSSGRDQLCQAGNENQAVLFSFLWIDGRSSCHNERFEDVKSIFKEQEEGQTPYSQTGFTPQDEKNSKKCPFIRCIAFTYLFIYIFLYCCYPTSTFITFKCELMHSSCFKL